MKIFFKALIITTSRSRLTLCLSLKVVGLIIGREWYKGWHSLLPNFLKIHLSNFSNQLKMETAQDVYLRLWRYDPENIVRW